MDPVCFAAIGKLIIIRKFTEKIQVGIVGLNHIMCMYGRLAAMRGYISCRSFTKVDLCKKIGLRQLRVHPGPVDLSMVV